MIEIITLTREQYFADMQEAAMIGATIALQHVNKGDEWLTMEEAMALLRIKSVEGFRSYRKNNKISGKDKVKVVGNRKLFNKKHLI